MLVHTYFQLLSFKCPRLCKFMLIYIVVCMCCDVGIMTYFRTVAAIGQGHVLTYTYK